MIQADDKPARLYWLGFLQLECVHCDTPFPRTYLRWHQVRAEVGETSLLRCKHCGLWTRVLWVSEG